MVPYSTLSGIIAGSLSSLALSAKLEFLSGFKTADLVSAAINTTAIIPSALRGRRPVGGEAQPTLPPSGDVAKGTGIPRVH